MLASTDALRQFDAELDSLSSGLDLAAIEADARSALEAEGLDYGAVDAVLDGLGVATELVAPVRVAREAARASEPAVAVEPEVLESAAAVEPEAEPEVLESAAAVELGAEPELLESAAPAAAAEPAVEPDVLESAPPAAAAAPAPLEIELAADLELGDDLLNPFADEPPPVGAGFDDDEPTMLGDLDDIIGLDMDALFDGMVEEALSSESGGLESRLSHGRPSSLPPPLPPGARSGGSVRPPPPPPPTQGAAAPDAQGEGDGGDKKGFFKKLFS